MKKTAFEIYNASAGSGKTYTLVKEYLKIILTPQRDDAYKNILAITFTNKAVEEMKTRIVSTLSEFSKEIPDEKVTGMLSDISVEIGKSEVEIREKSKRIIKNIIHNYASFDISTIDKFTHRVIRSFALDLDLPLSFEVSLDTENLLSEAVDGVIAQAGEDENLTKLLIDFTTEKTDEDKSWNITRDFLEISRMLTNENTRTEISVFRDKTIAEFLKIKQRISKICSDLENEITGIAKDVLQKIAEKNIEHSSFFRSYVPNLFVKISQGKPEINTTHYKRLENPDERYAKSVSQNQKDKIDEIALEILSSLKKINSKTGKLFFYKAFLKNLTPLSVLNAVNKELLNIQQDRNMLSISEFNSIIHNEIQNQPAPFIYEKLGDRYTHFFIDEFQDTSQMQWENLIPLIENSLSGQNDFGEQGSLMIVGDPKQSIYRWRGGKAEQFISLSEKKTPFKNTETAVFNLETNYRSFSEIIGFNNKFFEFLSDEFSEERYRTLYKNSFQKINSKKGGYVNLSFLDLNDLSEEEQTQDVYLKKTVEAIEKSLSEGFSYKEIAVLVRKKKNGIQIANYLTQNNIPIVSSETLLIANSDEVIFMVNLLEYLKNKKNNQAKAGFLYYLGTLLPLEIPLHDFLKQGVDFHCEKDFENWLSAYGFVFSFEEIRRKSLYETVEIIISVFVKEKNNVYVQTFLDLVLEQNLKKQATLDDFLNHWKENSEKLSIPSPEGNAIRIMTVHKSKGLEFPVVIFPFADEDYSRAPKDKLWVENELEAIHLPKVLVDNNKSVENYSDEAARLFVQKNQEELLDNINILYVALTRAEEQLYIISKMDLDRQGNPRNNTMSGFFIRFLTKENDFSAEKFTYEFGESRRISAPKKEEENRKTIEAVAENFDAKNIKIATREALMWNTKQQKSIEYGNLVHRVLSLITCEQDIEKALNTSLETGLISLDQKDEIRKTVESIVFHPQLSDFFNPTHKIFNERAIIRQNLVLKPDKVVLKPQNQALLLDYKTGEKKEKHNLQLENYAFALEEMKLEVTQKKLIYIGEMVEVVEV
ncbi:MAG: UvrD-helicase domain-containing protein [Flavobacteriaceae bacterium]